MLDSKNAIRIEKQKRKSGGPRTVFVFKCAYPECNKEIKSRSGKDLDEHGGKCAVHSHIKRPFESIYNGLLNDHRNPIIELTYEQFLTFTKIKICHYCFSTINWTEYSIISGNYKSRAYFLDRKDNLGPYSIDNCVVCCTKCNIAKGNRYSYEEWYGMTSYFRGKS